MEKIALACLPTVAVCTQNCGVTLTASLLWKRCVSLQEVAGFCPRSPMAQHGSLEPVLLDLPQNNCTINQIELCCGSSSHIDRLDQSTRHTSARAHCSGASLPKALVFPII